MGHCIDKYRFLYHFEKTNNKTTDFGEKLGDICLYPLREYCGHKIKVVEQNYQVIPATASIYRIALIVFALIVPVSLTLTVIGLVATQLSKTHIDAFNDYRLFVERLNRKPDPPPSPPEPIRFVFETDVKNFLNDTQDPAKIAEAVRDKVPVHLLPSFANLASPQQLPAVIYGCNAEKLVAVFEALHSDYRRAEGEKREIAKEKFISLFPHLTPEVIEVIGKKTFSLNDLLCLTMWEEKPPLQPLLQQKGLELLRARLKTFIFVPSELKKFSDDQLVHLCRTCGEEFCKEISSARHDNELYVRVQRAVFATKVNDIHPALLMKSLEFLTATPFLASERLQPEQSKILSEAFSAACVGVNLSALNPRCLNLILKTHEDLSLRLDPQAANTLITKAVVDCLNTCGKDREASYSEIPAIDRLMSAIFLVQDLEKRRNLFQALLETLTEPELNKLMETELSPIKAVAIVEGFADTTNLFHIERLKRLVSKLQSDPELRGDSPTRTTIAQNIFTAATPDQCVILWKIFQEMKIRIIRSDLVLFALQEEKKVEALVRQLSNSELLYILEDFTFSKLLSSPRATVKKNFLMELRKQNKMLNILHNEEMNLVNAVLVANQSEMEYLISAHITSSDQRIVVRENASEEPNPMEMETPIRRLFFGIGDSAWKNWDTKWLSGQGMRWSDAISPVIHYLKYAERISGSQEMMPSAFQGIIRAFSENFEMRYQDPKEQRTVVQQAKEGLENICKELNPKAQQAIIQKLPITKENIIKHLNMELFFTPRLLELILAVREAKTWLPEEMDLLTKKIDPKVFAQAFVYMNEPLQQACLEDIVKNNLQQNAMALMEIMTEDEKQKYFHKPVTATVEEV